MILGLVTLCSMVSMIWTIADKLKLIHADKQKAFTRESSPVMKRFTKIVKRVTEAVKSGTEVLEKRVTEELWTQEPHQNSHKVVRSHVLLSLRGKIQEAVADTGAQENVISENFARRL